MENDSSTVASKLSLQQELAQGMFNQLNQPRRRLLIHCPERHCRTLSCDCFSLVTLNLLALDLLLSAERFDTLQEETRAQKDRKPVIPNLVVCSSQDALEDHRLWEIETCMTHSESLTVPWMKLAYVGYANYNAR